MKLWAQLWKAENPFIEMDTATSIRQLHFQQSEIHPLGRIVNKGWKDFYNIFMADKQNWFPEY